MGVSLAAAVALPGLVRVAALQREATFIAG